MKESQRIVSFVPSLTETLIECDLDVVGRTRFCIHPSLRVRKIPVLGGTKDFNPEELVALKPDLVVVDREENKKDLYEFLQKKGLQVFVFHVTSVQSLADDLRNLASQVDSPKLSLMAERAQKLVSLKHQTEPTRFFQNSILNWSQDIQTQIDQAKQQSSIEYIIWRNPWMGIGKNTFISDVLSLAGIELHHSEKYPTLQEQELLKKYGLFSSEPFPFHKKWAEIQRAGLKGCLIDGEKISWYGIRAIKFLESTISTA